MDNLKFLGGNPGAVQYGNFINYYSFHPAEERLGILPKDIWNETEPTNLPFVALDIGCNTGDLTTGLHDFLTEHVKRKCYVLGIDIDPTLIERAQERNANCCIRFHCLDFMNSDMRDSLFHEYLLSTGCSKFGVVFCFSVTMWIHLNNGDEGLVNFLKQICSVSQMVVIEPQPWKCYRTAVRRMKLCNKEFSHFYSLKIRNNVEQEIENIILNIPGVEKICETARTKWQRKVLFFKISSIKTL